VLVTLNADLINFNNLMRIIAIVISLLFSS